ncbi:MAG: hypothetical protein HC896_06125 [Bacteroidales bacterium]|nr:hypothetical protein [Bacteroidales bacterium]
MKITFLIDSLRRGGKERRLIELLKYLSEKDCASLQLILLQDVVEYLELKEISNLKVTVIKRKGAKI